MSNTLQGNSVTFLEKNCQFVGRWVLLSICGKLCPDFSSHGVIGLQQELSKGAMGIIKRPIVRRYSGPSKKSSVRKIRRSSSVQAILYSSTAGKGTIHSNHPQPMVEFGVSWARSTPDDVIDRAQKGENAPVRNSIGNVAGLINNLKLNFSKFSTKRQKFIFHCFL